MSLQLQLPVRDPREVMSTKTIGELPTFLRDPEDVAVTRELLMVLKRAAGPDRTVTVGRACELLEHIGPIERKGWLDALRRIAGLTSLRDARNTRNYEVARMHYAPLPDDPHQYILRGGRIIDATEDALEASRAENLQRRLDVEREARLAEAAADAESLRIHDEAVRAEEERLLRRQFLGGQ